MIEESSVPLLGTVLYIDDDALIETSNSYQNNINNLTNQNSIYLYRSNLLNLIIELDQLFLLYFFKKAPYLNPQILFTYLNYAITVSIHSIVQHLQVLIHLGCYFTAYANQAASKSH